MFGFYVMKHCEMRLWQHFCTQLTLNLLDFATDSSFAAECFQACCKTGWQLTSEKRWNSLGLCTGRILITWQNCFCAFVWVKYFLLFLWKSYSHSHISKMASARDQWGQPRWHQIVAFFNIR